MKTLFITTALALFAAPAIAETKSQWGCEWQKASNGNYWFRVDGGCPMHIAMGYSSASEMRGKDMKAEPDDDEGEGPGDEGTDPGEGPDEGPGDDNAGPGDDGGNGAGPDDNGGGNEGPGTEGPSKTGKDRPGKPGKGKGRH